MTVYLEWLFWLCLFIPAYVYIFYGLLVRLFVQLRAFSGHRPVPPAFAQQDLPDITLVIAAWNEEDYIVQKLKNSLELDYPHEKVQFMVVADGSTDRTAALAATFPQVKVWFEPERRGKIHAVNRVMPFVNTEITVYTDANTMLNPGALKALAHSFADVRTGVAAGEKKVVSAEADAAAGAGEGAYWKYESWLKQGDAALYTAAGAAGELFAVRTALYQPLPEDTLIEDFVLSLNIAAQGYRIAYVPQAVASELPSASVSEEKKRKVRIAAGGLQAVWRLRRLFNIARYGWLSFQFVSHRALRWTLAPLALPLLFVANALLATQQDQIFYQLAMAGQIAFYLLAIGGAWLQNRETGSKLLFLPFYFVMMNTSVYQGLWRLLKGEQRTTWQKAARKMPNLTVN